MYVINFENDETSNIEITLNFSSCESAFQHICVFIGHFLLFCCIHVLYIFSCQSQNAMWIRNVNIFQNNFARIYSWKRSSRKKAEIIYRIHSTSEKNVSKTPYFHFSVRFFTTKNQLFLKHILNKNDLRNEHDYLPL
jgi:hypothetical protein